MMPGMKSNPVRNRTALTLLEVLAMTVVAAVLVGMVLPRLNRRPRHRPSCINHLKQIGLAFRIFATDSGGLFPMKIPTHSFGSEEYVHGGNAFRHFLAVSNELSSPKLLVCPQDKRAEATNWATLNNSHVSYFVGFDAAEEEPETILSGDRNVTNGTVPFGQVLVLRTNQPVGWTAEIHKHGGNVVFGDGHVDQLTSARLRERLKAAGKAHQRVAIP